ncbi:hypothetical protein [Gimibacter soli]|uniref:Uncharacterized protein n=1 Tax=Gimibacter soli TaxID=3024400 RepID=A0AAE9XRM9_9PROT|nr:hypothetical protein [Gimibacter soli]WCL55091.1 hypothetical protein PH603_04885 [Gimibacter soli]
MSIIYPLVMPSSPTPSAVELYIDRNQTKTESYSRLLQVQRAPGDRWTGKLTMPPMTKAQATDWLGFFDALDGFVGTFWMPHPDFTVASGGAGGIASGRVKGAGQLGARIVTDGWGANVAGLLRRGDVIQIGNHLHRVTKDVGSDSGGNATLDIAPAIYTAPADNSAVVTDGPKGLFRLAAGFVAPTSDQMNLFTFSFAVEGALE